MKSGEVRIIGGQWRSRKLRFPSLPSLRPTTDRNRETLFNWLMPYIHNARCLDLFAGSGALGFEALSRGAMYSLFVDNSPRVISYLNKQFEVFNLTQKQAQTWLTPIPTHNLHHLPSTKFDIIFLDPPFYKNLLASCCEWLMEKSILAEKALIYIETEAKTVTLPVPNSWQILHHKKSGQTAYYLLQTEKSA